MRMEVHVHGTAFLCKGVHLTQVEHALHPWLEYLEVDAIAKVQSLEREEPGVRFDAKEQALDMCWTGEVGRSFNSRLQDALQTLGPEDFPDLNAGELGHTFELQAGDLKRLLDKTRFAISTEETRYYLNGIFLHIAESGKKHTLRAVATDGHRLAQVEVARPKGADGMPGVIIPRKTVHELHRLLEGSSETVAVGVSPAKVRFEIGAVTLTSKLIDGTFPDYGRVIPQGNDKEMKVANAEFMSAVDRVSTIASERGRAVKLNIGRNKLVLSVNNPEGGSATEELSVHYGATPLEIGFNARYLLDVTQQIQGEDAQFALADAASPTLVRDEADASTLYVLMPMRV